MKIKMIVMLTFLLATGVSLAGISQGLAEDDPLGTYKKEMKERPLEAFSIARQAAKAFPGEEKHLLQTAADQLLIHLDELNYSQIMELAKVLETKLGDPRAARKARFSWLKLRGMGLSQEEVRQLLGPPKRTAVQILYRRQLEQWLYEQPNSIWLIFISSKGQISRLQTVHADLLNS
jgi:hypothetical protein